MKNKILWFLTIGLVIFLTTSMCFPKKVAAPSISDNDYLDSQIIYKMINQYRTINGIAPINEISLCDYAKKRSEQIISDWSHKQYKIDSLDGGIFYKEVCPKCKNSGENLSRIIVKNKELMLAWENSPTHNENLLDQRWDTMCIGTSWNNNIPYVALEFGDIN